jgi:subtilisin family serine protease
MNFQRSALITTLLVVLLIPAADLSAADSATVDPLLLRLQASRMDKGALVSAAMDRVLAIEETGNPADPRIGVILHLENGLPYLETIPGLVVGSVRGSIATARLPLSSLAGLSRSTGIKRIEASRIQYPTLDIAVPGGNVDQVWAGAPAYTGEGVLVGVIDSGIDWTHDDFKNNDGTTRIKAIWDLYGTGTPPSGFGYGAEYSEAQINAGTVAERDYSGHGTHVTGIAAGNGRASGGVYKGVAYEADILFAKPYDDSAGGFAGDKVIDAINYLVDKAESLGQPIAINMSLGGHSGPHDGTSAQEVLIDAVSGEGVAVCIAAGNEGEAFIHDSASANGGQFSFFVENGYTPNPDDGDDYAVLEVWVEQGTSVTVASPNGTTVGPVTSGTGSAGFSTPDGAVLVDNASAGTNPANGDQMILIQLDDQQGIALASGNWIISFAGGTGTAHAWKLVSTMFTGFPDSDQSYSVGVPGTAEEAITVAAWKSRNSWPSSAGDRSYASPWGDVEVGYKAPFSSVGPTRDERQKPDLSAPGMAIISCYSKDSTPFPGTSLVLTGNDYMVSQGTSMACPFTCGVTALLMERNSALTAGEIKTALRSSALSDAFTGPTWNARSGAGKIDAAAAIAAVVGGTATGTGDVNLDGTTSVLDVILMVNYILDDVGHPLSPEAVANANVNGDALVNALDLVRVVAFILGTDTPDKSGWADDPAVFAVGRPYTEAGRWWVDARLSGRDVAAGQFALTLRGAVWDAQGVILDDPSAGHVAARAVGLDGEQIRVLIYDLDNELPAAGVTLRLPLERIGIESSAPQVAGLLLADPSGEKRSVINSSAPSSAFATLGISPNPMAGAVNIQFNLGRTQTYTLSVYDLRGRRVRALEQGVGSVQPVTVGWDGRDGQGRVLPSGVYFVRLTSGSDVLTSKIVLSR